MTVIDRSPPATQPTQCFLIEDILPHSSPRRRPLSPINRPFSLPNSILLGTCTRLLASLPGWWHIGKRNRQKILIPDRSTNSNPPCPSPPSRLFFYTKLTAGCGTSAGPGGILRSGQPDFAFAQLFRLPLAFANINPPSSVVLDRDCDAPIGNGAAVQHGLRK